MSRRTKIILSFVGIAAVVVPVILLVFMSSNTRQVPEVSQTNRPLDTESLETTVKKTMPETIIVPPTPSPSPSPLPSSPSAM